MSALPLAVPRPEYPRPRLRRERWINLNGPWRFAFDDEQVGLAQRWFDGSTSFPLEITVPFCFQSELSGIDRQDRHDVVWYSRIFADPRQAPGERLLLHLGAVDYAATVWVNGVQVAAHEGGHTPITADISHALRDLHEHVLTVRAEDPLEDLTLPRGKQYWRPESRSIFYTATTGIWQTVWLEPVAPERVTELRLTGDLGAAAVDVDVTLTAAAVGATLRVVVGVGGTVLVDDRSAVLDAVVSRRYGLTPTVRTLPGNPMDFGGLAVWSPEDPRLYDVRVEVIGPDGGVLDAVDSYFGLRSVSVRDGRVYLNDRPRYLRLVLDQGYFPGGLMTAGTDQELRQDIELAQALGFDGARKHQKIEDPRWLYWADRLGFLVWEELPSAYAFSATTVRRLTTEWQEVLGRDAGHPCIIAWVPINESWGVPALASDARQRELLMALYHLTRALDPTRLVVSNDGWEQATTDLLTIHDYGDPDDLRANTADLHGLLTAEAMGRPALTVDATYRGAPVLITEFGGVSECHDAGTWGYETVPDGLTLLKRYGEMIAAVTDSPVVAGFCYTQLTDVEQETNGLLTFQRVPKAELSEFAAATRQGLTQHERWRLERTHLEHEQDA